MPQTTPADERRRLRFAFGAGLTLGLIVAGLVALAGNRAPAPIPLPGGRAEGGGAPAGSARFTLRLGEGFRFRDGAVVRNANDRRDLVFQYVAPRVGPSALRYNPVSEQVELGLEPWLTAPMPLLLSTHLQTFPSKPDVTRITSGDVAAWSHQAPVVTGTRYVLLMTAAGDPYLLTLDLLEAPTDRYGDWRIGFTYEPVRLPLGSAGGRISRALPGRLVYRDWARTRMVMSVDLTTGLEEAVADGTLPSASGGRWLAFADSSQAYVVRDARASADTVIRFDEEVRGPLLSPDGTRILASVWRQGPDVHYGGTALPGGLVAAVGVFDLAGREIVSFPGHDDAAWTPDGRLVATGKVSEAGLFELDPATKAVRPIDARMGNPGDPSVSPDGRTVAFVTGGRVWLIDRDGQNRRQVLPDRFAQQRPAFSPDGTMLALVACNLTANDLTGEVFVVVLASREVIPVRTSTGDSVVPDAGTRLSWVP